MSTLKSLYPKIVTHEFSYLHQFTFPWLDFEQINPDVNDQKEIIANVCVPWVKTMRSGYEGFGCLSCSREGKKNSFKLKAVAKFCVHIEIRPRGALVQFHSWCGMEDCKSYVYKLASKSIENRCSSCGRYDEDVDLKVCVNCKVFFK